MRIARFALAALAVWLTAGAASAQSYPDKPVRLMVGFTPGSSTDITARIMAEKFAQMWKVPVTVENLTGSSGAIAADKVSKSEPNGYTLMWSGNAAMTIVPTLQGTPYDPVKDFAPISQVLMMPSLIAINNDVPAKTLQEFIALAKKQPGKLSYASPGVGTPQHIAGEMLKKLAGIDMVHVPYRGAVFTDVIAGRVPMTLQNAGAMMPVVRQGQLRALAVTSLKRSSQLPDLPTVAEQGFPGFEAISWFGLFAPPRTPAAIVNKIRDDAVKIINDPKVKARFEKLGLETVGSTPAEVAAVVKADLPKWAKVIKEAGIKK